MWEKAAGLSSEPLAVRAGETLITVPESLPQSCSPLKILLTAEGVAGLLTTVGYPIGLAQGGENPFFLAGCCGTVVAFVILLGYGPVVAGYRSVWLRG